MIWPRFLRRRYWDAEQTREMDAYLQIETDENIARGMTAQDARSAARRKLGNPILVREEIYRMNSVTLLEALWRDLRYAARMLRLNAGFAGVAITSLALGIGANTAIFQLLDAVRLRTLPVANPRQLAEVKIRNLDWPCCGSDGRNAELTTPLWDAIRERQNAFSGIAAWSTDSFNIAPAGEQRFALGGLWVSGDFFNVLGVRPVLGRVFAADDDRRGCGSPGVVISYAFFQREFGGRDSAIGSKLPIDGHPFEVIGVTPANFFGVEVGRSYDVAVPLCADALVNGEHNRVGSSDIWWLAVIGRLLPGWTLAKAASYFESISSGVIQATIPPSFNPDSVKKYLTFQLTAVAAGSGVSQLRETYETPLWLLLASTGLVLLIACANLANLMLARASAREREMAMRLALGASRGRLIRQLLAESLLLATIGAALGAFLARSLGEALIHLLSTPLSPAFVDLNPDWRVFAFTAISALGTCIFFGLTPALRATRSIPGAVMKASSRGLTQSPLHFGLGRALVVLQVSLSLVLLVGALLFSRSFRNLSTLDAGFRQEGILEVALTVAGRDVPPGRRLIFREDVLSRLRSIPGVVSAAEASIVPLGGSQWIQDIYIDETGARQKFSARFSRVSAGYFKTLDMPLIAGRDFNVADTLAAPRVAVVNEAFARNYFHGENPIGKSFRLERTRGEPQLVHQIIGWVKNTKYAGLREDFKPIAFVAASQQEHPAEFDNILIRSSVPMSRITAAVRTALREMAPGAAFHFVALKSDIQYSLVRERLMATLSSFFGFLAALLATIGIYGLMSYVVARRRSEIGIRMALGADRRAVVTMVVREAALLVAAGLGAGIVLALAVSRAATALLFGLKPNDPLTIIMAVTALAAVALAASYLPARRAAGLDPTVALREE